MDRIDEALPTVIPAMDQIDESLASNSVYSTLNPPIRAACKLAKKSLNEYYARTDLSALYRIALGLRANSGRYDF